jgi:hypothetical protein
LKARVSPVVSGPPANRVSAIRQLGTGVNTLPDKASAFDATESSSAPTVNRFRFRKDIKIYLYLSPLEGTSVLGPQRTFRAEPARLNFTGKP